MKEFKKYNKTRKSEMRPYIKGEILPKCISRINSKTDIEMLREGDMIARNPDNHNNQWLITKEYFTENFEEIKQ